MRIADCGFSDDLRPSRPTGGSRLRLRTARIGEYSAAHQLFPRRRGGNPKSEIPNPKSPDAGYTLVLFVMVIAVMAIMMGIAVQQVSFQMQREREAELIFRGEQYVEALRLYRAKYGRYPMRMKEMWEADPRVLRKKWTDPIPPFADWQVVHLGEGGPPLGGPGGPGTSGPAPTPTRTPVFERERGGGSGLGGDGGERIGPIVGVRSRSTETSIKIYKGKTSYNEWLFILEEQPAGGGQGSGGQGGGQGGSEQDPDVPWGQPPTPPPRPQPTGTPNY